MPHPFLSDEWLDEIQKLQSEAPEPPASMKDLTLNIIVTGAESGDKEVHITGGQFAPGLVDGAPTKLTVPIEVAKAIFIDGNQQAGMQAFMSGQIKVEGDMTKLMAMQSAGGPSPEQAAFQQKIKDLTA